MKMTYTLSKRFMVAITAIKKHKNPWLEIADKGLYGGYELDRKTEAEYYKRTLKAMLKRCKKEIIRLGKLKKNISAENFIFEAEGMEEKLCWFRIMLKIKWSHKLPAETITELKNETDYLLTELKKYIIQRII